MKVEGFGSPVTLQRIVTLEKSLGVKLPKEYEGFLLKNNGGRPSPSGFCYLKDSNKEKAYIAYFLGLDTEHENLEEEWNMHQSELPEGVIPVARDPGGNFILLGVNAENLSRVYYRDKYQFWDWRDTHEEEEISFAGVYLVCDSFQQFVDELFSID